MTREEKIQDVKNAYESLKFALGKGENKFNGCVRGSAIMDILGEHEEVKKEFIEMIFPQTDIKEKGYISAEHILNLNMDYDDYYNNLPKVKSVSEKVNSIIKEYFTYKKNVYIKYNSYKHYEKLITKLWHLGMDWHGLRPDAIPKYGLGKGYIYISEKGYLDTTENPKKGIKKYRTFNEWRRDK